MLICLVGESASGKSTLEKMLVKNHDYKKITSYTTRPRRHGEVDGIDYHYVSVTEFDRLKAKGHFAEVEKYREWFYAMSLHDIDYINEDYIVVVTVRGLNQLKKVVKDEHLLSVYIHVDERERMHRLLNRGDEVDEIIRRIQVDRVDFMFAKKECKHIIDNKDLYVAEQDILDLVGA
jgi:guanylate kinase